METDAPPTSNQRAEWKHVYGVLREAQQRLQATDERHSWMDGAIGIAEARARGEDLSDETTQPAAPRDLSPCPFCASTDLKIHDGVRDSENVWLVQCVNCEVTGPVSEMGKKGARRLWNERSAVETSGWRPIETAMKDETTPILVCNAAHYPRSITSVVWEPVHQSWACSWDNWPLEELCVTHWMPVPSGSPLEPRETTERTPEIYKLVGTITEVDENNVLVEWTTKEHGPIPGTVLFVRLWTQEEIAAVHREADELHKSMQPEEPPKPARDAEHCDFPDCEQHNALVIERLRGELDAANQHVKILTEQRDETSDRIDWKARAEAAEGILNHNMALANATTRKVMEERNAIIRKLRERHSAIDIAEQVGLTRQRVHQILNEAPMPSEEPKAPTRDAEHCDYPDCEQHNALVIERLRASIEAHRKTVLDIDGVGSVSDDALWAELKDSPKETKERCTCFEDDHGPDCNDNGCCGQCKGSQVKATAPPCGNPVMINSEWYRGCRLPSGHEGECSAQNGKGEQT